VNFVGYLYIVEMINVRKMEHSKIIHTNSAADLRNVSENFENIRDSFPPCVWLARISERETTKYGMRWAFRTRVFVCFVHVPLFLKSLI
jgi:hypothetical protein